MLTHRICALVSYYLRHSKISKQRLQILTFQIRPLIWQLAFILLEFWEPLVIMLQNLFAGLVWNVAGYVVGIIVLLKDGGLLGMGWSVAECLHWSVAVGVFPLEEGITAGNQA